MSVTFPTVNFTVTYGAYVSAPASSDVSLEDALFYQGRAINLQSNVPATMDVFNIAIASGFDYVSISSTALHFSVLPVDCPVDVDIAFLLDVSTRLFCGVFSFGCIDRSSTMVAR